MSLTCLKHLRTQYHACADACTLLRVMHFAAFIYVSFSPVEYIQYLSIVCASPFAWVILQMNHVPFNVLRKAITTAGSPDTVASQCV